MAMGVVPGEAASVKRVGAGAVVRDKHEPVGGADPGARARSSTREERWSLLTTSTNAEAISFVDLPPRACVAINSRRGNAMHGARLKDGVLDPLA